MKEAVTTKRERESEFSARYGWYYDAGTQAVANRGWGGKVL